MLAACTKSIGTFRAFSQQENKTYQLADRNATNRNRLWPDGKA